MDYTSIKVGQLPSASIAGSNLIPHEVDGLLKKATITDLAAFISANGAVGFRAVSVPNGGTLPSTTQQEFILVGPGTYNNVGGGSPVTVTEELNALVSNGTFWFIGVQIPIEAAAGGTANWGGITGTLSAQTDLQTALNNKQPSSADLSSIAGLTGTTGLLRKTAANTYSLDTNSYALDSEVVKLTGDQTITGIKTFDASLKVEADLHIKQDSGIGSITGYSAIGANSLGLQINNGSGRQATLVLANNSNRTYTFPDSNGTLALTSNLSSYLPLTGGTIESSGSTNTLNIIHSSGSGIALNISKNGNGEGLTIVKGSGTGNAASITGGVTLLSELNLTTKLADTHINSAATWNAKIGGSGTTNFLPKFTGSSALGNSQIFDNGTNVGIGTTSPSGLLHLASGSDMYFKMSRANGGFASQFYRNAGAGTLAWQSILLDNTTTHDFIICGEADSSHAVTKIVMQPQGGNVGIGITSPTQKLDVNGLINSTNGISVGGSGVSVVWTGTQAAYDAIATKSSTTIYFIQ
jgi:hypothetical protein